MNYSNIKSNNITNNYEFDNNLSFLNQSNIKNYKNKEIISNKKINQNSGNSPDRIFSKSNTDKNPINKNEVGTPDYIPYKSSFDVRKEIEKLSFSNLPNALENNKLENKNNLNIQKNDFLNSHYQSKIINY